MNKEKYESYFFQSIDNNELETSFYHYCVRPIERPVHLRPPLPLGTLSNHLGTRVLPSNCSAVGFYSYSKVFL